MENIQQLSKQFNSKLFVAKQIDQIQKNTKKEQIDKNKHFVFDQVVIVENQPKKFYYMYDNDEYYFTAKNAKFEIDRTGKIIWFYGQWIDGFFRDGLWIDGVWHNGTFCRGNWLDGQWKNGNWFKGQIDGTDSIKHP